MNDIIFLLLRATLLLSAAFGIAAMLLRITRCRSWFVHRTVWFAVPLIGVLAFVPWSGTLEIPVLRSNGNQSQSRNREIAEITETMAEIPFAQKPQEPEVLTAGFAEPPFVELSNEIAPTGINNAEIATTGINTEINNVKIAPTQSFGGVWKILVIAFWIAGMLFISLRQLIRFIRVRYLLRDTSEPCGDWSAEWEQLQRENKIAKLIEMRVAENLGPALIVGQNPMPCSVLIVPLEGWDNLSAAERRSVMLHELAHYRRGDIWTSLFARILALPHWFNPLARLAIRRYEEAAEWACDEAALGHQGESAAVFAKALVSLQESASVRPVLNRPMLDGTIFQHNIFGQNISRRVVRLMTFNTLNNKESMMKKAFLLCVCVLLIGSAFVQIRLTAQQPNNKEAATVPANGDGVVFDPIPAFDLVVEKPSENARVIEMENTIKALQNKIAELSKPAAVEIDAALEKEMSERIQQVEKSSREMMQEYQRSNAQENEASIDPDFVKLLRQRVETAKFRVEDTRALCEAGTGTLWPHEEAKLALAEAEYALKKLSKPAPAKTGVDLTEEIVKQRQRTREYQRAIAQKFETSIDPDFVKLLRQRVETAKFRVEDTRALCETGRGTLWAYEEAKLALAEAEYALKKTQQIQKTSTPVPTDVANPFDGAGNTPPLQKTNPPAASATPSIPSDGTNFFSMSFRPLRKPSDVLGLELSVQEAILRVLRDNRERCVKESSEPPQFLIEKAMANDSELVGLRKTLDEMRQKQSDPKTAIKQNDPQLPKVKEQEGQIGKRIDDKKAEIENSIKAATENIILRLDKQIRAQEIRAADLQKQYAEQTQRDAESEDKNWLVPLALRDREEKQ
ncbi:hypothetical protein FACS189454_04760 [Planctomycetales bacterium]|nr:hypothetical protein FACS189454_04760 [Planctomycetales bacterium]